MLHGKIKGGKVVFDQPVVLPEGAEVRVEIVALQTETNVSATTTEEIPSLLERLGEFVGKFEGLPPDFSVKLDNYLYRTRS